MNVTNHAHVRLELSSKVENVPLVRQVLNGLAAATGLAVPDLNDIGTAVTEACNNASVHAYGDGEGPLEVEFRAGDKAMVVTVRDRGVGLALDGNAPVEFPSNVDGELAGIGVPSIKALAKTVSWSEPAGGGTEVEMTFSTGLPARDGAGSGHGLSGGHDLSRLTATEPRSLDGTIVVGMAPAAIACSVLPRLLRVMAARAYFSVDRHADVQRVGSVLLPAGGSISADGSRSAEGLSWDSSGVQAQLTAGSDSLEIAIGPVSEEQVSRLAAAARAVEPELDMSTEQLDGGLRRLVLSLGRSPAERHAGSSPTSDERA